MKVRGDAMVTCDRCNELEKRLRDTSTRASEVYTVGNPARAQMGHAMYFTTDGRTALCAANRRTETV